jgi:glycosyltransferase involved in cell wall biosynthesis
VFDAIEGVRLANRRMTEQGSPISFRLLIGGNFVSDEERTDFEQVMTEPDIGGSVTHLGFVSGERKDWLLRDADVFCFPTWYQNENQPVNLIEAMAYGLPIVTTRWRSLPEMFPENYAGLVEIRAPEQIANALIGFSNTPYEDSFRRVFLKNFNSESYLMGLAEAFRSVDASIKNAQ